MDTDQRLITDYDDTLPEITIRETEKGGPYPEERVIKSCQAHAYHRMDD